METTKSTKELAKAVGRSERTINRWRQLPTWPIAHAGPWPSADVRKLRAWVKENFPGPDLDSRELRMAVLAGRAERLRLQNAEMESRLHSSAKCHADIVRKWHAIRTAFLGDSRFTVEQRKTLHEILGRHAKSAPFGLDIDNLPEIGAEVPA